MARKHWSILPHRTQSNRSSFTPAAAAEWGSKLSRPSTSAQASACAVPEAKAESSKVARPEQGGPQISVRPAAGKPPVSASTSAIRNGAVSTCTDAAQRARGRVRRGRFRFGSAKRQHSQPWSTPWEPPGEPKEASPRAEPKRTFYVFAFVSPLDHSGSVPSSLSIHLQDWQVVQIHEKTIGNYAFSLGCPCSFQFFRKVILAKALQVIDKPFKFSITAKLFTHAPKTLSSSTVPQVVACKNQKILVCCTP